MDQDVRHDALSSRVQFLLVEQAKLFRTFDVLGLREPDLEAPEHLLYSLIGDKIHRGQTLDGDSIAAFGTVRRRVSREKERRVRYTENLMLRSEPRDESHWQFVETPRDTLVQMAAGRFKGWHLAADERISFYEPFPMTSFSILIEKPGPYVQNLTLREKPGKDSYWRVTTNADGSTIQVANGPYAGWYLDFVGEYFFDTDRETPSAWNRCLNPSAVAGTSWKISASSRGRTIQATSGRYMGWYLDAISGAKVLERELCWGENEKRERQAPSLAK